MFVFSLVAVDPSGGIYYGRPRDDDVRLFYVRFDSVPLYRLSAAEVANPQDLSVHARWNVIEANRIESNVMR